nr:restriction endonuclease subunit S [uncultured Prevotella sp.]
MMQSKMIKIGDIVVKYRQKCGDPKAIVSGVDINKQFISTRANLEGTDISGYYVVPPRHFACNLMHIGRDERIPVAYNSSTNNYVVTSAYYVFKIKENKVNEVLAEYLYILFCVREFDRLTWFYTDSSIRGNLKEDRFLDIKIPLPSLAEQQKVVNAWKALREIKEQNEAIAAPLMQVCQSYIQELKHKYESVEIGNYIEESNERNNDDTYRLKDVCGISIEKKMIDTKANMDGVSLKPYKVFKPSEFCFVPITSRNGNKITLSMNYEEQAHIVSSSYVVFDIKEKNKLIPSFLYLMLSRPEFDRYARFNSWGSAREAFSFDDMKRVCIPLPPLSVQQAIVNIYNCANEAKRIAAEADRMSREVCPALIQHVIHY